MLRAKGKTDIIIICLLNDDLFGFGEAPKNSFNANKRKKVITVKIGMARTRV